MLLASTKKVAKAMYKGRVRTMRFLSRHKQSILLSVVSAVLAVSLWGVSFRIWQAWSNTYLAPILTTTKIGPLQVRAFNAKNEIVAKWVSPQIEPILLPKEDLFLDIVQPGRIGYRHVIHPSDPRSEFNQRPYTALELATPLAPRWSIADVEWAVPVCLNSESLDKPKSVVGRVEKKICLFDMRNGDKQWQYVDPLGIDWGCTPRGPPSTFQPDRLTSIPDIDNDEVDDLVLSHPNLPELLCLSGSDGKELWRSRLFEGFVGSPTPDLVKLTPVLLEPIQAIDGINRVVVVVCPNDYLQGELNRWIVSINTTSGKAEWHRPSALYFSMTIFGPSKVAVLCIPLTFVRDMCFGRKTIGPRNKAVPIARPLRRLCLLVLALVRHVPFSIKNEQGNL